MNQNLFILSDFYTVANTGNISKVAKELFTSASPPSANPSRSSRKASVAVFSPQFPAA